jgi:hypothetical protein
MAEIPLNRMEGKVVSLRRRRRRKRRRGAMAMRWLNGERRRLAAQSF